MNGYPANSRRHKARSSIGVARLCGFLVEECVVFAGHEELERLRAVQRKKRSKIVLWRHPLTTVHYFFMELLYEAHKLASGYVKLLSRAPDPRS